MAEEEAAHGEGEGAGAVATTGAVGEGVTQATGAPGGVGSAGAATAATAAVGAPQGLAMMPPKGMQGDVIRQSHGPAGMSGDSGPAPI